MAADARPSDAPPPAIGGSLRTDLLLAGLLLVFTVASLGTATLTPVQVGGGVLLTLVGMPAVLVRRHRPRLALAVVAVPAALGYAVGIPSQPLLWTVVAFAMLRAAVRGGRTAGLLALTLLGVSVTTALGQWLLVGRTGAYAVGYAIGLGTTVATYAVIGAVLGRVSRAVREREQDARAVEERRRLADAMATERTRIADEIGSGVLQGLRRLTTLTRADLGTAADVDALQVEARQVLTGMRRALAVLREPATAELDGAPPARRRVPAPTRSGLAIAVVVGVLAVGVDALPMAPSGQPDVDRMLPLLDLPWSVPLAFPLLALQLLAVGWWRSAPTAALALATVGSIGAGTLGATNSFAELTWMVIVYGVGVGVGLLRSALVTAAFTVVLLTAYLSIPTMHGELPLAPAAIALSFAVVPALWLVGVARGRYRRRTDALRRRRESDLRRNAVEAERLRVARELHDVVAHHVSAISVQAGAARIGSDPRTRAEAARHIAESGRRITDALPELDGLTPDPGTVVLTDRGVRRLVEPVRAAGLPVTTSVYGEPAQPPGDAELFAQRILTEALTNAVRHAGASATRVRLEHTAAEIRLQVDDSGPVDGHLPHRGGSGLGLLGMRERAELLGGTVEAGPGPDRGWSVRARLPRPGPDGLLRAEDDPSGDLLRGDDAGGDRPCLASYPVGDRTAVADAEEER